MLKVRQNLRNVLAIAICLAGVATTFAQETGVVINGVTWATRNVGIPNTFVANPEDEGMYYQWNSKIGWSATDPLTPSDGTSTWDNSWKGNGATVWETANNVCPTGWRVPTVDEIKSLIQAPYEEFSINNINGCQLGSGLNTIFLPYVGFRYSDGSLYSSKGIDYWSSTLADRHFVYHLYGNANSLWWQDASSAAGAMSIRCVKDNTTGVKDISANTEIIAITDYFDMLGRKLKEEPTTGIYIIQYDNGKTKKVMR